MKFTAKKVISIVVIFLALIFIVTAITLAFRDDDTNNTSNVNFTSMSYCAYGDSITFGLLPNDTRMEQPYPTLVSNMLNFNSFENLGFGGASFVDAHTDRSCITNNILNNDKSYDVISIMGGVNDYIQNFSLGSYGDTTTDTVYGSLYQIAEYVTKNCSNSYVFFMTPIKAKVAGRSCLEDNGVGYSLVDVVFAIKTIANDYDIPVLDLFSLSGFENIEMNNFESDGIHPSQSFMTNYLAPQIAQFIKNNYSK